MKEHPILFSAPMVRAILDGTKTQTRRVLKEYRPSLTNGKKAAPEDLRMLPDGTAYRATCPYGQPSDHLWVRETFMGWYNTNDGSFSHAAAYRADGYELEHGEKWRPSIHMPRAASRISLEITGVRIERLQEISEADALAEGIEHDQDMSRGNIIGWRDYLDRGGKCGTARGSYQSLWAAINSQSSWDANPWVWVVEFKRLKGGAA